MTSMRLTEKIVAEIGEDLPFNDEFYDIHNLNNIYNTKSFPLFDFIAKRKIDNKYVLFSAKGRNTFDENGNRNPRYNILQKSSKDDNVSKSILRKINQALKLLQQKYVIDIKNIEVGFIICPIQYGIELKYYWGYFSDIKQNVNIQNMIDGNCESLGVLTSPDKLKTYNLFGIKCWEDIKTKYLIV